MQSAKEKIRFENLKTQNHRIIMPSKCFVCGSKKSSKRTINKRTVK